MIISLLVILHQVLHIALPAATTTAELLEPSSRLVQLEAAEQQEQPQEEGLQLSTTACAGCWVRQMMWLQQWTRCRLGCPSTSARLSAAGSARPWRRYSRRTLGLPVPWTRCAPRPALPLLPPLLSYRVA